ncbi:hypothetical protein O181_000105 [Austropuccinia psidii MF-1]|uniref:Uncharacterized protein n=1 Tax=Austropuccinia psidii MF-1 TaxID=1389203 RepID=A0A9Q3GAI8_9BASI|nr:hypothetical protein [Austropuccinia psidii MF-1]
MDAKLQHKLWNPKGYHHKHPQEKELLSICGLNGFKLISPKHTPTYLGETETETVIDLAWGNLQALKIIEELSVSQESHLSDNQPLIIKLTTNKEEVQTS